MWLHFIRDSGGWTQILTPQMPMVLLYTDAATTENLSWGHGGTPTGHGPNGTPSLSDGSHHP